MINKIGIMQGRFVPREIKSRLQSFPFKRWKKEIKIAKENNIKFIEWTIDYKNFLKNPIINNSRDVKKILKKNKINVDSITCDFFMQKPFFKKKGVKSIIFKYLSLLLKSCIFLKIKFIVLPLVDKSSIINSKEEKILVNELKKFVKNNYLGNIKVLFELDYKPHKVRKFLNNFDNKFGINYDTGNSSALDYDIYDELIYFDRVYNIHIKDRKKKGKSVRLGQGNLKLDKLILELKKIRYRGNLILQTYIPVDNKKILDETLANIEFLKKAILKK